MKLKESQLRLSTIFTDAQASTLETIINHSRLINYTKARQIVGQADTSTDAYMVVEGEVRAKSFSEKGKEVSYRDIGPGELFGEFSAIDEAPRSTAVLAVTDCVVAKIPASIFRESVTNDPQVALALIELLIEKNRTLTERMHEFGTLAVRFRIQSELLRLAEAATDDEATSVEFEIPTHSELANRICTHREAVTKELNYLVSTNQIEVERGTVIVRDYQKFRQLAGNLDY